MTGTEQPEQARQSGVCQAALRYDGKLNGGCPYDTADLVTVTVVCVHEHIFDVVLCPKHIASVESKAQCPWCASSTVSGDRRHRCNVRIHRVHDQALSGVSS